MIKRCPNIAREEYLLLGHALKYVILSSKLRNIDEVSFFRNIEEIQKRVTKVEKARTVGIEEAIPVLVYGNSLFNYALGCAGEEIWNSDDGYDILVLGENCELALS